MPIAAKRNALLVFALSCLFSWSFFFAKHSPALRHIISFGEDPYDAVGSFAVIVGTLLTLLSLVRALRPYRYAPSATQRTFLLRSQDAVVMTIFLTIASDLVAMARHPSLWITSESRNLLIALLAGLAVLTAMVHTVILASRETTSPHHAKSRAQAAASTLAAILILALYPEHLVESTATHLLTVLAADFLLFAPIRLLLKALIPIDSTSGTTNNNSAPSLSPRGHWLIVILTGASIGAGAFLLEISEGTTTLPYLRLALVGSVFTGLGLSGVLIAYALLRQPLGLTSPP